MNLRVAGSSDIKSITDLINLAFVIERFFIDGNRTENREVRALMDEGVFLLAEDAQGLAGCVYLQPIPEEAYLGLLSVEPSRQHHGIGKRLMDAAEAHARGAGCTRIRLHVVNLRTELLPIYRHLGYSETGTLPFPEGHPTKLPCHLIKMAKSL